MSKVITKVNQKTGAFGAEGSYEEILLGSEIKTLKYINNSANKMRCTINISNKDNNTNNFTKEASSGSSPVAGMPLGLIRLTKWGWGSGVSGGVGTLEAIGGSSGYPEWFCVTSSTNFNTNIEYVSSSVTYDWTSIAAAGSFKGTCSFQIDVASRNHFLIEYDKSLFTISIQAELAPQS